MKLKVDFYSSKEYKILNTIDISNNFIFSFSTTIQHPITFTNKHTII